MLVALRLGQAKPRCCEGQSARSALKVSVVVMLRTGLCSCVGDTMTMLGRCFFPRMAGRLQVEVLWSAFRTMAWFMDHPVGVRMRGCPRGLAPEYAQPEP